MRVESLRKASSILINTMKAVTALFTVGLTVAAMAGIANMLVMIGQEYPEMLQHAGSMEELAIVLVGRFILAYIIIGAILSVLVLVLPNRKKMGLKEAVLLVILPVFFLFLLAGGVGFISLVQLWNIGWVINTVSIVFILGWVITAAVTVRADLKDKDIEHDERERREMTA